MKIFAYFFLVFLLLDVALAVEEKFTATLYQQETQLKKALFLQEGATKKVGDRTISKSIYVYAKDPKKIAAEETLILNKNGFLKYVVEHKQLSERWIIDRFGSKLLFKRMYLSTGEVKKDKEDIEENFVVAPMIMDYLRERWGKVLRGDTIKIRLGVAARRETIGFKLFKDEEIKLNGEDVIKILVKPTNFIIALLVDPVEVFMRKKDKVLLQVNGRTLPREKDDDDWEELDVDIIFKY